MLRWDNNKKKNAFSLSPKLNSKSRPLYNHQRKRQGLPCIVEIKSLWRCRNRWQCFKFTPQAFRSVILVCHIKLYNILFLLGNRQQLHHPPGSQKSLIHLSSKSTISTQHYNFFCHKTFWHAIPLYYVMFRPPNPKSKSKIIMTNLILKTFLFSGYLSFLYSSQK